MMMNEQMAEIRARCEKATPEPWGINTSNEIVGNPLDNVVIAKVQSHEDLFFLWYARSDIPTLLDALEETEAVRDSLMKRADKAEANVICLNALHETGNVVAAERNRWKKRAKALERAVKSTGNICFSCVHASVDTMQAPCKECYKEASPLRAYTGVYYEFDEERFAEVENDE